MDGVIKFLEDLVLHLVRALSVYTILFVVTVSVVTKKFPPDFSKISLAIDKLREISTQVDLKQLNPVEIQKNAKQFQEMMSEQANTLSQLKTESIKLQNIVQSMQGIVNAQNTRITELQMEVATLKRKR